MANDKDPVFCAADIIKRAKLAKEFKTDSELAAFLGISRSTLSNWNARNSIDFPLLLGSLDDVDYNWLLTGKGSPAHHSKFCDNDLVQGEVEILHTPKTTDPMDDRSVTLYDISAAANLKTLLADRPQYALGRIVIPNIPVCDGAVYVSGDSMYPILKSGDIVGFKSIRDFTDVIYGEMYLVSFERGGDEYLAVKYVNHSERPDCILNIVDGTNLERNLYLTTQLTELGSQCNGHREVLDKEEYDDVEGGIITGNFVRKLLARIV